MAGTPIASAVEGVVDGKVIGDMKTDCPKQNKGERMADKGKSIDEKTASEQYAIGSGLLTWLHNNQLIEIHNPLVEVDLSEHKGKG